VRARSADAGQNFQRFVLDFNAREEKHAGKRRKDARNHRGDSVDTSESENLFAASRPIAGDSGRACTHRLGEVQRLTSLAVKGRPKDIREAHLRPGKECLKRNLAGWWAPESTGSSVDGGKPGEQVINAGFINY
jgi:hypothetical protein